MESKFLTQLIVEEVDEFGGIWQLEKPLAYYSQLIGLIRVPAGFKTDFASVPRLPATYLLYGGKGQKAAVIHDWLYSTGYEKRKADLVLKEAMLASGYSSLTAEAFYAAVRVFGGSAYAQDNLPQRPDIQRTMDLI